MLWWTLNPWFCKCWISTAPTELKSQPTNTNFLHQPEDHILVPICSHSPFVHGTLKDTSAIYMDFSEFILDKFSQILTLLLTFFLLTSLFIEERDSHTKNIPSLLEFWWQYTLTDPDQGMPQKSHHTANIRQFIYWEEEVRQRETWTQKTRQRVKERD